MNLQSELLPIIVFHDVFDFPLTGEEVWEEIQNSKFPPKADPLLADKTQNFGSILLLDVKDTLERMVEEGVLEKEEVFYCLKGRKEVIGQRKIRYPISLRKMIRARKWVRLFSIFPFINHVFIAGTVAEQSAKHDSDIDLVVETRKERLWTARFFLNAFLSLLGKRPRPGNTCDTFCTSFFYDETFVPELIMPDDPVFQKWIGGIIHESPASTAKRGERITNHPLRPRSEASESRIKSCVEFFIGLIPESIFRWVQIHVLMPRMLREANGRGGPALTSASLGGELDVYFDSRVAKFHLNNRRKEFNNQFQKKLIELKLT